MARKWLGDLIESALSSVGITHERVEKYIYDCGCKRRKQRMNEVHQWAERVTQNLYGSIVKAKDSIESLLGKTKNPPRINDSPKTGKDTPDEISTPPA